MRNDTQPGLPRRAPQHHRTVDRVTRILETVVCRPGIRFTELARTLDAPMGSVHGFISGLLANGWLYEQDHRFYLGPAVYALTLASGNIRAGLVTHDGLLALHEETGAAVFLGVQAGDHLLYVAEVGSERLAGFAAQSDIRRPLLRTAGGKALLAARPAAEREAYLRHQTVEGPDAVDEFLAEYEEIRRTRIATHLRLSGTRFAVATAVLDRSGDAVASVTLVGPTSDLQPRVGQLARVLLRQVDSWPQRSMTPREAV
jgi:DNA-binding IclR family transcriptional regulator